MPRTRRTGHARILALSASIVLAIAATALAAYTFTSYKGVYGRILGRIDGTLTANQTIPPGTYRVLEPRRLDVGTLILESPAEGLLSGSRNVTIPCHGDLQLRRLVLRVTLTFRGTPPSFNLTVYGDGNQMMWAYVDSGSIPAGGDIVSGVEYGGEHRVVYKGVVQQLSNGLSRLMIEFHLLPQGIVGVPRVLQAGLLLDGVAGTASVEGRVDAYCVRLLEAEEGLIIESRAPIGGEVDGTLHGDLGYPLAALAAAVALASWASILAAMASGCRCECVEEEPPSPNGDGAEGG